MHAHGQQTGRLKEQKTQKVVRLVVVYEEFSERELFLFFKCSLLI